MSKCVMGIVCVLCAAWVSAVEIRPNILVLMSDDQSWLDTGAAGCRAVKTPNFDRLAAEGVLFTHAFADSPGCAPSRGAMLSGQAFWRLREGAVQRSSFPADIPVYPEALRAAGYQVGMSGKGWGPGVFAPRRHNPAGKQYKSFEAFLKQVPAGAPFCFWLGSLDPHRPYTPGSGLAEGKRLEDAVVPPFLPDVREVRGDLLDYYAEIDRFDRDVGTALRALEDAGQATNTLVILTSDNGMPFPRAKANLYDYGVRVPLAIRWLGRVKGGRVVDDFVTLSDCAPTILEAAGLKPFPEMTAHSFLDVLLSGQAGRVDPARDHAVFGRERHGKSWPARALRDGSYLYVRNFAPERLDGLDSGDVSPSKTFMAGHAADPQYRKFYELALGPRPAEELYEVRGDAGQMINIAALPEHAAALKERRERLAGELKRNGDPRILGQGKTFDDYPNPKAAAASNTTAEK